MKKLFPVFLLVFILTAALTISPAAAEGLSFSSDETYRPAQALAEAPLTFEATIRVPADAKGRGGVILSNYGEANPTIVLEIFTNGQPKLSWTGADKKQNAVTFNQVDVRTGEWLHLAIVRDIDAGKVLCYVDGKLVQEAASSDTRLLIPSTPLCLGGDMRTGNALYFRGEMKNAAVFSDVRTADEILADVASRPLGDENLLAFYDAEAFDRDSWTIPDLSPSAQSVHAVNRSKVWLLEKEPVTDYAYSFAVIGDTQIVSYYNPELLPEIYEWIVENKEEKKIEFVIGLGDITEKSTNPEWKAARAAISLMDGKVRYSVARGNHDGTGSYSIFFPYSKYKDQLAGAMDESMRNTYQELVFGNIKYLIFTLDYAPNDNVLAWAGDVIAAHPYHNVIITTHAYIRETGELLQPPYKLAPSVLDNKENDGTDTWEKLVSKYENIVMVICGHISTESILLNTRTGDHGNIVTELLVDFQDFDKKIGPCGMICMLYFSEDGSKVTTEYYSPIRNKYYGDFNCFTFDLPVIYAP